jgi:hypothetical protein
MVWNTRMVQEENKTMTVINFEVFIIKMLDNNSTQQND